jgi:hypothetical protein
MDGWMDVWIGNFSFFSFFFPAHFGLQLAMMCKRANRCVHEGSSLGLGTSVGWVWSFHPELVRVSSGSLSELAGYHPGVYPS